MKINDIIKYSLCSIKNNKTRTILGNIVSCCMSFLSLMLIIYFVRLISSVNITIASNFMNDSCVSVLRYDNQDINSIAKRIKNIENTYFEIISNDNVDYIYTLDHEKEINSKIYLSNSLKDNYKIGDDYIINYNSYKIEGFISLSSNYSYAFIINDSSNIEIAKVRYVFYPQTIKEFKLKIEEVMRQESTLEQYGFEQSNIIKSQNTTKNLINVIYLALIVVIILDIFLLMNSVISLLKILVNENKYFYSLLSILGSNNSTILKIQLFCALEQSFLGILIGVVISFFSSFGLNKLLRSTLNLILEYGYDMKPVLLISNENMNWIYVLFLMLMTVLFYLISLFKIRGCFKSEIGENYYEK